MFMVKKQSCLWFFDWSWNIYFSIANRFI